MDKRAVFLDKDGTLIENVPFNVDVKKIHLREGVLAALRRLQKAGYLLFVVTNEPGIALGHYSEADIQRVGTFLRQLLRRHRIQLDGFYYCPHHPDGIIHSYTIPCFCRKPNPGLIFQAAREHNVNLAESWVIGDILNDIEAGNRANCRTILMDIHTEPEWNLSPLQQPHYTVKSLPEAVDIILTAGAPKPVAVPANPLPVKVQKLVPKGQLVPASRDNGNGKYVGLQRRVHPGAHKRQNSPVRASVNRARAGG